MKQFLSFKAIGLKADGDTGIVTGRASVYGNVDAHFDSVQPGAFTKTLQEHGGRIVVLSQHDPAIAIGTADLVDRADGLHFRAQLLVNDVQAAREDFARVKAGAVTGVSIGYETIRDEVDRKTGVRKLLECRLWEISIVTFPSNGAARVTSVKRDADATVARLKALTAEMRSHSITGAIHELTTLVKANQQLASNLNQAAEQAGERLHARTRGKR